MQHRLSVLMIQWVCKWVALYLLLCLAFGSLVAAQNGIQQIKHIVFIIKENRTFDNYFGTFPGANGVTMGTTSSGEVIPLSRTPDSVRDM